MGVYDLEGPLAAAWGPFPHLTNHKRPHIFEVRIFLRQGRTPWGIWPPGIVSASLGGLFLRFIQHHLARLAPQPEAGFFVLDGLYEAG